MAEESTRLVVVRSAAKRRALAVAMSDGSGGGGLRDVVSVVRKSGEGGGRFWERMEDRS